jgi:putative heme transporter
LAALVLIGAELREAAGACAVLLTGLGIAIVALVAATIVGLASGGRLASRLETACRKAALCIRRHARRFGRHARIEEKSATRPEPRLRMGRGQWAGAFTLAALNWLADAAALALSLLALGIAIPLRGLLFAYAVSQLAASLPVTPGGIGIAEGSMALALVCAGVPAADALAATLAYRLVTFWLQLLPGGMAWLALRRPVDQPAIPRPGHESAVVN